MGIPSGKNSFNRSLISFYLSYNCIRSFRYPHDFITVEVFHCIGIPQMTNRLRVAFIFCKCHNIPLLCVLSMIFARVYNNFTQLQHFFTHFLSFFDAVEERRHAIKRFRQCIHTRRVRNTHVVFTKFPKRISRHNRHFTL